MSIEIITTEDGSHSLYNESLNEVYHSRYGAVNESLHVFIKSGLEVLHHLKSIEILEVGFGTGLNAYLTYYNRSNQKIRYTTLEPFPLDEIIINKLNYPFISKAKDAGNIFNLLHSSDWESWITLPNNFELLKNQKTLQETRLINDRYNLVYFDAFSPEVQPELWTITEFSKIFKAMKAEGYIVTYSARGSVRRAMQTAGFQVERIPGPAGKREMLRGIKSGH